jgi:hypothetical protein
MVAESLTSADPLPNLAIVWHLHNQSSFFENVTVFETAVMGATRGICIRDCT